ncbi:expansin EXLX1 family cellulose-binding protein [Micromonospora mirobrigensis]|uniref:Peptidoglycan-binding domain-containing protein, expansin n=1 Tax=Micromonospora mirobrigensis TaxID=262898 RepID=A0A1C4U922_9ACTN|nr:expansin EXLX1 family cellulose-binding protein [Micromonospora mirobrigensis]SCE68185.1 Peptidoglycan-binding domain-containing protein, expansin [Micromonospora mirobrigensis]
MTDPGSPPTPPRRPGRRRAPGVPSTRTLAGAAAAALAALLGITLALRAGDAPACAAPPAGGTTHTGRATFYDSHGGGGNCSYPSAPADRRYVALGPTEYAAGAACGGQLDVTGPRGTVRVLVTDQCPECEPGHLDLSAEAFARIADPVQGVVPVSYRVVVDPPLPGPLTFRIKEGASRWWFAVLVGDHGNPLRSVEVRQGGSWRPTVRQDYNYWLLESGAGPGPYTIRVTDVRGHRATATGIGMAPGRVQRSDTRMYGGVSARPSVVQRSPSPSRSVRASATAPPRRSPSVSPSAGPASSHAAPAPAPIGATVVAEPPLAAVPVAGCTG